MKCTWTDKAGGPQTCNLLCQDESKFCPRHTFLHNLATQKKNERDLKKWVDRKAPTKIVTNTRQGMIESGHQFVGNRECYGCGKPIELWRNPKGNNAPWDPMPELTSYARSHFATCTQSQQFRQEKRG